MTPVSFMTKSTVGAASVAGVSVVAGVAVGGLAGTAASAMAELDLASVADSDPAGSVDLIISALAELASPVLAASGAGACSSKSARSKSEEPSDGGVSGSKIALPEAENRIRLMIGARTSGQPSRRHYRRPSLRNVPPSHLSPRRPIQTTWHFRHPSRHRRSRLEVRCWQIWP